MTGLAHVRIENIDLLKSFIAQLGVAKDSFRYFNKRGVDAINNHLVTILYLKDDLPIGYGHLDKFDNEVWLGIAILSQFQGKGIGHQIMDYLIKTAKEIGLQSIALTVDHLNTGAISLYLKKGFKEEQIFDSYTKYRLII